MVLKPNGFTEAIYIRDLMKKALPDRKCASAQDVYNVRMRALLLMKQLKSDGQELATFNFKPDNTKLLFKPLDEINNDIINNCVTSTKEIYYDFLNDDKCSFSLFTYLDSLAEVDAGFTYNIAQNDAGQMTGFCWMTSVMRSYFERFHVVIFLDAMRRKTNAHLWPYMSVVIVNDLGESRPVCEAIMMGEQEQSYVFFGTVCSQDGT